MSEPLDIEPVFEKAKEQDVLLAMVLDLWNNYVPEHQQEKFLHEWPKENLE
jgi:hypothetical protein